MTEFRRNVTVILTRPSLARNIGAAARAMKTMGFTQMVLVSPKHFPHEDAVVVANRARDVLDRAIVVERLVDALVDVTHAYAFAATPRDLSHPAASVVTSMREARSFALHGQRVALVFGNETYGLSNEEVMLCNRLTCIPTAEDYESLNLAQAVQVATFTLAHLMGDLAAPVTSEARPAPRAHVEALVRAFEAAAIASGFLDPMQPKRMVQRLQRLFARAEIEPEEVAILRGILASLTNRERRKDRGGE